MVTTRLPAIDIVKSTGHISLVEYTIVTLDELLR
jgi:hypothetical protein